MTEDRETALRRTRTKALKRHARALATVFDAQITVGKASSGQVRDLNRARDAFEELRPHGWRDAEVAYVKDPDLAREAGSGRVNRAIRALQLETELRIDTGRCADRFVARWRTLDQTGGQQYRAADMSGYDATRLAMRDMAKSLERDPQLESLLANRKRELGISFDSGRRLGRDLAFNHAFDYDRGRGLGL